MCNFQEILSQLNQKQIAIFCDEGVYHIACHIKFVEEEKFKDIILMLGNFHFTKVLLGCIGKYVRENGKREKRICRNKNFWSERR